MKSLFVFTIQVSVAGLVGAGSIFSALAQSLTVQVGAPPPPPTPLVNHGDIWHYRKGSTEPQTNWKTAAEASLDGTWLTGPGGFGFGDSDDATVLSDMLNGYNTVYIRRTFTIPADVDPARRVMLTMDWDDGFVAYLDGVELVRSPNVAVAEPLHDSATVAGQNHEAAGGESGNPATTYDLGSVGALLAPGTHVLAIHGLNAAPSSSDFSLIADLALTGGSQTSGGGALFAIVNGATNLLSGTNTIPGATRVTVDGREAVLNLGTGEWSLQKTFTPGLNRLFVAALDATGAILASTNRDVFLRQATVPMGGDVVGGSPNNYLTWAFGLSTILVTNTITVKSGTYLLISNTLALHFSPGTSLRVEPGAALVVKDDGFGATVKPVFFGPADGATPWNALAAQGGFVWLHDCEVVAGQLMANSNGTLRVENSIVRDLPGAGREIIAAVGAAELTLRKVYAARFGEMDSRDTPVLIEDSLLEQFTIDGLDIKTTNQAPLIVRRTTLRRADPNNTNADAIDFGPGAGTVEDCLIHGFPDKGVSVGGASGTRVSGSLIYDCGIGLSAYASSNLVFVNNTVTTCSNGVYFRDNPTPAFGVATNMIVWANTNQVAMSNTSGIEIRFSDIQGATVFPGAGNINQDPQFVSLLGRDFRLAPGSPAVGTAFGGGDMGARFPVGGLPGQPLKLEALVVGTNNIVLRWQDDSENELGFELERLDQNGAWSLVTTVDANTTSYVDPDTQLNQRYLYRVFAFNGIGKSEFSNPAGAIRQQLTTYVAGTLPGNNVWSPAMGTIVVVSNVVVPSGASLAMLPGTAVKLTNNASIVAAGGGTIDVQGSADTKVQLQSLNAGALWGQLSAQFGGSLTVRHADVSGGQITVYSNAVGVIEDSYIHDYRRTGGTLFTAPIILTHFAASMAVRRVHVREYHETLWRNGVITIEDSLFEQVHGDAVDFDAAQPGTAVRRCTFRHGNSGNVDAVDVGPDAPPAGLGASVGVLVEDSLMYDFPFDKGVSCGDSPNPSVGTVVRNCLIYNCLSGVMAKDNSFVTVSNCTIVANNWGFTNYNKVNPSASTGGGHTTNSINNILWNNGVTISMANAGTLTASYNILGNTNWPGVGNINVDPLFVNPGGRDYRLAANSPARGAGSGGSDLGTRFPVGAPMVRSHPRIEAFDVAGGAAVVRFWADSEKTYSVLSSDAVAGGNWVKVLDVGLNPVPRYLSVTNTVAPGHRFYRLVTPALP